MLAVIGGTGLCSLDGLQSHELRRMTTPFGEPSAPLRIGHFAGSDVVFLPRHGDPHRIPPHKVNYRANIDALRMLGVERVLAINTVGGITAGMNAGHLVVPHDLIDYSWGREHTFSDGSPGTELQHIDFSEPFDRDLRMALLISLENAGCEFSASGIYAVTQGPRLETAAEIRKYERDGCSIVGMTAMPEAALARELGLRYAMLCLVVNPAAGKTALPLTVADMNRVVADGMTNIHAVLTDVISRAI